MAVVVLLPLVPVTHTTVAVGAGEPQAQATHHGRAARLQHSDLGR